ncbi:UPF0606 protein KIAA1549L homolog isoform X1 [Lithobates pipiens]
MEGSTTVELTSRVLSTKPFIEVTNVEQTYSSVEPTATVYTSTPVTPSIEAQSITNLSVTIGLENTATDVSTSDSETGTSQTTITLNTSPLTTNQVSKSSAIMDSLNTQTIETHIFTEINTARTNKETISETLGITVTTPFHYTTTEIGETQGLTGTENELSSNAQSDVLQSTTPPELHTTSESSNELHTSIKGPMISGVFTSLRTSPTEQSSTSTTSEYTSSSYFYIDTVSRTIQPTTVSKLLSVETMASATELTNSESAMTIVVATDNVDTTFSSTSIASPVMLTLLPSQSSEANTHSSVTSSTFSPLVSSTANSDITESITEESTYFFGVSTNTKSTTLANIVSSSISSHTEEEITSKVSIEQDTTANASTAVTLTDDTTVSTPGAIQNETATWNVTEIPSFTSNISSIPSFTESATETSSSITTFVTSAPGDNTEIYPTDSTGVTNNPTVSENYTVFITAITNVKPMTSNMSPSDELTTSANNIVDPNTNELITTLPLRQTNTSPLTNAISDSLTTWVIPDVSTNLSTVEVSASTLTTSETVSETFAPSMSTDIPSIEMHTESPYSHTPVSNQENTVSLSTMTDFGTSTNNTFITTSSQESTVSLPTMTDFGTSKDIFLTTSSQESTVSLPTMTDFGTSKDIFLTTSSQESPVSLQTMTDFGTSKNNAFLTTSSQESPVSLTLTDFGTSKRNDFLTTSSQESPVSLSTMTDIGTSKNNDFLTTSSQETPVSLSTLRDFGTSKNNDFLTTTSQESTISLSTMTDFKTSINDASLTDSSQESPVSLSTMTDFVTSKNNDLTTSSQESPVSLSIMTDIGTSKNNNFVTTSSQESTISLATMTNSGTSKNNDFLTTSSQSPVSLSTTTDFGTSKNNDFLTTDSQESTISLSTMTDFETSKNYAFLTNSSQESPVSLSTVTDFGTSKNNDFLTTSSQESTISLSTMTDIGTSKNNDFVTTFSQESTISLSTMTNSGTSKNNDFLTTSSQSPVSLSTLTDFGTSKNNDFLTTDSQESTISLSTMTDFETSKNYAFLTNSSQESPVSLSTVTDFGTSKNNDFLTTSSQESEVSLSTMTDIGTSKNNDFVTTSSQESTISVSTMTNSGTPKNNDFLTTFSQSPVSLSTMTDFGTSKNNDFLITSSQESPVSLSTMTDFGTSEKNDFLTTSSQESTISLSTMTDFGTSKNNDFLTTFNQESSVSLSTITNFETSKNDTFLTTSVLTSNLGTSIEQNTIAPQLTTKVDEITTSNLITSPTINEISTEDSDLTSSSHLLNSLTTSFSSPTKATSAATTFVSTWTSSATSESEADTITEHNTKSSAVSSITKTEPGTSTSTGSSMPSFSELSTYPNTDAEQSIPTAVSDVTSVATTPINILTSVTVVDYNTEISTTALPSTLNTTAFSSSQGAYTDVVETSTQAHIQPTLTTEVISEPAIYTSTNTITKLPDIFSTVSSFQTSSTSSAESQTEDSNETVTYNTVTAATQILQTYTQPSQQSYSSSRTIAHLSMSTQTSLSPSITSSSKQEYINQTSQETSQSTINKTFSTTESSVSQPTSGKLIEPEATSTNTYSLSPTNPTNTLNLTLSSESMTSSTHMQTTGGNITITQHNTTDTAETFTYSGSTSHRETLSTVTESITKAISNTMPSTTSHLPSPSITSPFSSTFPYKTAIVPTNISGSFSTVSTMSSSAEVSSVSPAGNATKNFTTVPSSSYITHTVPTSHASVANTLLTAMITRTPQVQTSNFVTSKPTNFTIANHTTYTPVTVVPQTAVTSSTVLVPPSSTNTATSATSTTTHAPTTHVPTTITATTLLDTNTTPTAHTGSITISTVTSIVMSTKTTKAPLAPVSNATTVLSTILSTILSTPATTPVPFGCQPSSETMIRTVLTLSSLPTSDEAQRLRGFLSGTLSQALNMTVQVLNLTVVTPPSTNLTVGYSVSVNSLLYIPSAIVSVLTRNDVFDISRLKTIIPTLQSVPVIAETWKAEPAINFRLRTVLKLMGTGGNVNTCVYVRSMEQKLQKVFAIAELNSMGTQSNLSVQILSTSKVSQSLTLIYVVKNNSQPLDGTTASSLLNVLSGEVVGYYLGDPASVIAEPLYYPTLDTSDSTMKNWVTTVIQGVDSQLLGSNNQSFAKLMEERLATLFQLSSQQSRRFKRATTVGSYTVQMVSMKRLDGANNLAELIYYALKDGQPILGTVAAKQLSTIDPQTMALTLGYIVKVQANSVVQNPPNNLWIIAAVLAPIAVVTVIIIIITAVLCRKNKSDFKSDNLSNMPPRTKPVQGFDYAKQHLGQQGGDEDALPVTHETVVPSLNLSQERDSTKDGSTEKMLKSSDTRKSRSPCENGSVISNESEEASSDGSTPQKLMAQHRMTKDEACKWNGLKKNKQRIVPISDEEEGNIHFDKNNKMVPDPFDSSSGSVKLIAIKPVSMPPSLSVTDRNQEMSIINGEVNKALKQKSDIEHYRNKLRLKAKRKGYYDFPPIDNRSLNDKKRKAFEKTQKEIDNVLEGNTDSSPPFAEAKNRQPSLKNHPYRSRQSLNSPSPGETEMDLLVTRERPRRGIRNSGYDTEPEIIEETNIDRVKQARTYIKSRQGKGHSETSTLSSQPSIDEVRQQMHMLLEEAFSLASAGHGGPKRQADPYASVQHMPYSEVVTSAPGTMSRPRMQWVPTYGPEMYQYSLPRPTYRFSQLPEMAMGSPPPPVPPRTGPVAVPSLRRSTSDMTSKNRVPEPSGNEQSPGNTVPAVFAIPGNRAEYTSYYIPQPPAAYRNHAWMSYSGENDLPGQWADSAPLPGYIEAYPRSRYPQNSPSRLPRQFGQSVNLHPSLDHAAGASIGASQQSLADTDTPDASITNLSTAALVKAIREEVAKLAKKQTDMFEFQV